MILQTKNTIPNWVLWVLQIIALLAVATYIDGQITQHFEDQVDPGCNKTYTPPEAEVDASKGELPIACADTPNK